MARCRRRVMHGKRLRRSAFKKAAEAPEMETAATTLTELSSDSPMKKKAIDKLEQADATLRDVDNEIMAQHESIFEWMANKNPEQTAKGNPYGG